MSVRNSMYRVIFVLIAVPFLLFSLLITNIYSGRLQKAIIESLTIVASAQVAEMTSFCEQQKDYLTLIGNMDMSHAAMRGELDGDMKQYLDNMLYSQVTTMNEMSTLTIIDSDYRVTACSEEHDPFAHDGIQDLISCMQDQPFYISNVLTDEVNEKTLVAIARIEENGEVIGYTLAEIKLDFYKKIREQAELWNESTFYLLDGQQQIISAGTADEERQSFVTTIKEREHYNEKYDAIDFQKEPQGSFQYKVGGKDYITYYSNVGYTDWRVLLSVNMDNYQAQRTVYIVLMIFLVMLCSVLAVWIGWFASKRIVHPIKSISRTLKEIRQHQDYSLRVKVERQDEMGTLAGEINELINFIETEDLFKTQQQRVLREKAEQDALTKVLNKERITQYLQDAMESHRREGTGIAVLFVDIDDFKDFNTRYGHSVGDQVLMFLTSLLGRETAGTVGRVGGDEFVAVVEAADHIRELDALLKQIEKLACSRFVMRGSSTCLPVYCSIGAVRIDFSHMGGETLTLAQVIDLADDAMYRAKNNGKRGHVIMDC